MTKLQFYTGFGNQTPTEMDIVYYKFLKQSHNNKYGYQQKN